MPHDIRVEDATFGPVVRRPHSPAQLAVLYLHGDRHLAGEPRQALPQARAVAERTGYAVLCARYSFSFPRALDDVREAYERMREHGPVAIVGERLGGGLAAALMLRLRDEGAAQPACGALLSPLLDFTLDAASLLFNAAADRDTDVDELRLRAIQFAGPTPATHPLLSPLHGNLHGVAPLQLQAAGTDVLLDDALGFAARAACSGVTVDLRVHEDPAAQQRGGLPALTSFLGTWSRVPLTQQGA